MLFSFAPVPELRQHLAEIGSGLFGRELLVGHVADKKFQQLIRTAIGESAIGIAPFAVLLIELAVRFTADDLVTVQRHAATLADQLTGIAQQVID